MSEARAVCLIPARSGSTRIPDKNLQPVGASTLLERAIATANKAFGSTFVSTDSERYAAVAEAAGAMVPGLRPPALATDDAAMDGVIEHAVSELMPDEYDVLVLLQPTAPFILATDLIAVAEGIWSSPASACSLTAVAVPATTAFTIATDESGRGTYLAPHLADLRTQDLPTLWRPTGGAFGGRWTDLRAGRHLVRPPFVIVPVPDDRALDIDTPDDLAEAQRRLAS